MGDTLNRALEHPANTIPELIGAYCGVPVPTSWLICDPRPGKEEQNPSFSINETGTLFNRFGNDGLGGSAFGFLLSMGMSKRDTALELIKRAGLESEDGAKSYAHKPNLKTVPKALSSKLEKAKQAAAKLKPLTAEEQTDLGKRCLPLERVKKDALNPAYAELERRGLIPLLGKGLTAYELRGGNLAFEVSGPDGQPWALKYRRVGELKAGEERYSYLSSGHGAPSWLSPGYGTSSTVLFAEGEFNGMAAYLTFKTHGAKIDVQGIAGAAATPYLTGLEGKQVYIYADGDAAGEAASQNWAELAVLAGAAEVYVMSGMRAKSTPALSLEEFTAQHPTLEHWTAQLSEERKAELRAVHGSSLAQWVAELSEKNRAKWIAEFGAKYGIKDGDPLPVSMAAITKIEEDRIQTFIQGQLERDYESQFNSLYKLQARRDPQDFCEVLEQARRSAFKGSIDELSGELEDSYEPYGVIFRHALEGIKPNEVSPSYFSSYRKRRLAPPASKFTSKPIRVSRSPYQLNRIGTLFVYQSDEARWVKLNHWLTEGLMQELRWRMDGAELFTLEPEPEAQAPAKNKSKNKKGDEEGEDDEGDKKKPASTRLLEHTEAAGVELWHDTDQNPYMSVPVHGEDDSTGRHTFRLPSSRARSWLEGLFYREENKAIAAMAVQEALGVLKARAVFDGESYPAGVRILALKDVVYLDLGTAGLEVIEINRGGWIIRSSLEVPVRFWRPAGLKALPIPTKGGNLLELKKFLNTNERGFVLVLAWLTAALSGRKPYPILAFSGEQGTGKSTASRVCRDLLDPNTAGLRSAPKNERDLFISAKNGHVLSFENLSVIGPELSDSMCRMATGGGFGIRTLYADDEETLFDAARPIVLNGIPELATRPDLADRTLSATLERIEDTNRKDEATFWAEFEAARAGILGALCTAVSTYLRNWESTQLKAKPRMADFARLIVSAESALPWKSGEFLTHYSAARADLAASTLEGDEVARGVALVLEQNGGKEWIGTADELHGELKAVLKFEDRAPKSFPPNARALSSHLTRIAPALRQTDIVVEKERTNSRRAIILRHLRHAPLSGEGETPSETNRKGGDAKGDAKYQGGQADEGKTSSGTAQRVGDAKGDANLGGDAKGDANGIGDAKVTQEKMFASPIETASQTKRLGFTERPVTQVTQNYGPSISAKVKRTYDNGDD